MKVDAFCLFHRLEVIGLGEELCEAGDLLEPFIVDILTKLINGIFYTKVKKFLRGWKGKKSLKRETEKEREGKAGRQERNLLRDDRERNVKRKL